MAEIVKKSISSREKRSVVWKEVIKHKYMYLILLPLLAFYLIFAYIPMYGIVLAFKEYEGGRFLDFLFKGNWVGFKYFNQLFSEPLFFRALGNTIIISLMGLVISFPLTIIVALALNEIKAKMFKKSVQTIVYLPHFFSWVIIGSIVMQLLNAGGVINEIIKLFGGGDQSLLTNPAYFRWVLVFSNMFKEMGWGTIIYLAAMSGISPELYEAGDIDGATRLQKIRYITLPGIAPTVSLVLLISISFMISGNFEQVFMLYNPGVYQTGDILDTFLYRMGLAQARFSFATTVGLFKSLVSACLLIASNYISRKFFKQSLW